MRKQIYLLLVVLIVGVLFVSATPGDVFIDPAIKTIASNTAFDVVVKGDLKANLGKLTTIDVALTFDKDKLEIVGIDGLAGWTSTSKMDNALGTASLKSYTFVASLDTGVQSLFTIHLKTKSATGDAKVTLTSASVKGTANALGGNLAGAIVTITAPDLCAGVTCPDKCEGTTQKTGGSCSNGVCSYATSTPNSAGCGYTDSHSCSAPTPDKLKDETCTNFQTDLKNCGQEGKVCVPPDINGFVGCTKGVCELGCNSGYTLNQDKNCAKESSCRGSLEKCGESCVDARTDASNCGTCGTVCDVGETCKNAVCTTSALGKKEQLIKNIQEDNSNIDTNLEPGFLTKMMQWIKGLWPTVG